MAMWNLWHGCIKYSAGCQNCYVYRGDQKRGIDSRIVRKTNQFDAPIQRKKDGTYKIPSGTMVYTCFTSDFLIQEMDENRQEAWKMIKERKDLNFFFITKRIERLAKALPSDWGDGYDNVIIGCTVENQSLADYRLPLFRQLPIKHRIIICEPLLTAINLDNYLDELIEEVVVGGESGYHGRPCYYDWILLIRESCLKKNISFWFKQTGTHFIKDNKQYFIERKMQHIQARKANINYNIINRD